MDDRPFFEQAEESRRRGFVGSASAARADEAAWNQQVMRQDAERQATLSRFGGGFFDQKNL